LNSVPKQKIKEKTLPARSRPQNPKKKGGRTGGCAGGEEGQWSCFGACGRVLQRLHTKAKRLLQEEAEELLARTLARSLAPSFVVVWLCLFCGCCMYTPAPKSVIAACTPAAPLSPLAALPLFTKRWSHPRAALSCGGGTRSMLLSQTDGLTD
jgi:hypothetical protein